MSTPTPPANTPHPDWVRREYSLRGIVQGVGFRPHFATTARHFDIAGIIGNSGQDVFLHLEGTPGEIDDYMAHALSTLPPLAKVLSIAGEETAATGEFAPGLRIVDSLTTHTPGQMTLMPADVATCADCLREMLTPTDRRYLHPLITCTNCGPRLSIITGLPYDRPNTTLADFPLCPDCQAEYTDPTNRRFHAQPISCYSCGPRMWFEDAGPHTPVCVGENPPQGLPATWGPEDVRDIIATAHRILDAGGILAVKGIGGFHLIADATNPDAVACLRQRKHRPHKPLAVMVRDLAMAAHYVNLPASAAARLSDPAAPIVLCRTTTTPGEGNDTQTGVAHEPDLAPLADAVAPGLEEVGIVLAYTPLYHQLCDRPLVCTSGNPTGQPLCHTNEAARTHLGPMVDGFIFHNRPIHTAVEDSVETTHLPIRRSRGRAPHPLPLPQVTMPHHTTAGDRDGVGVVPGYPVVLAIGGENKNTLCLTDGGHIFASPHIGTMEHPRTRAAWRAAAEQLLHSRGKTWADIDVIACDAHPTYATTQLAHDLAEELGVECQPIQHHLAHCLSLLVDHAARHPNQNFLVSGGDTHHRTETLPDTWVIAACDGTGYGDDHSIYGGEIYTGHGLDAAATRISHLPPFPLIGGDNAITHPWRTLAGINHAFHLGLPTNCGMKQGTTPEETAHNQLLADMAAAQLGRWQPHHPTPTGILHCTSTGRLLDAIACLLLGVHEQTYEGHAPMLLQAAATRAHKDHDSLAPLWEHTRLATGIPALLHGLIAAQHAAGLTPGQTPRTTDEHHTAAQLALVAHTALGQMFGHELAHHATEHHTTWVGLTGGCAINPHLTHAIATTLREYGLKLRTHHHVPPTDGGLSLGQAAAAAAAAATPPDGMAGR